MLCSARPRKAPSAWGDVEDFEGDWRRIRRGAVVGRTVSELFQSAAGRRLCRISAHALAERIRRSRTGRLENRQPAAANNGLRKATTPDRAKSRNASAFSPHVEPHNDGIVNDPEIKAEASDLAVDRGVSEAASVIDPTPLSRCPQRVHPARSAALQCRQ